MFRFFQFFYWCPFPVPEFNLTLNLGIVSPESPLLCDSNSVLPWFSWPWQFWIVYVVVLVVFKYPLHLTWGLNSQPQDQELHAPPTEPGRHPWKLIFKTQSHIFLKHISRSVITWWQDSTLLGRWESAGRSERAHQATGGSCQPLGRSHSYSQGSCVYTGDKARLQSSFLAQSASKN